MGPRWPGSESLHLQKKTFETIAAAISHASTAVAEKSVSRTIGGWPTPSFGINKSAIQAGSKLAI